eukprot:SRR837773.25600.p2 GENE.SRR837773.25600~~SRR837773.25600.p2  ORF type:complete len:170 (-),score=61.07 SRR837773.25600:65-508(-)
MDARLHFTNARRLRDFALKAIAVREESSPDVKVEYLILDMKSVNGIDLSGSEMLHVLAEYLHSRGQGLVLVNLKAPIASCLHSAGLVDAIKHTGGHFCLDIQQALTIIKDASPSWTSAEEQVQKLIDSAVANANAAKPSCLRHGKAA